MPLAEGEACTEETITFNSFVPLGDFTARQTNFINGIRQPRLVMAPGQIERWRILQATALEEVFLALARGNDSDCSGWDPASTVPLVQYARDGVVMPRPADGAGWPYAPDYLFMSPGYRIEAFLDGSAFAHGDTYCLIAVRFAQDSNSPLTDGQIGMTSVPTRAELLERADVADVLAIVNVTDDAGPPTTTQMPDLTEVAALAPPAVASDGTDLLAACADAVAVEDPAEIDQVVAFQVGLALEGTDSCGCCDHNVNCENFERVSRELYPFDRVLPLGALEHWRVYSLFDGHPFHIHINPYFVCPLPPADSGHPNAVGRFFEPSVGHWRDTYLVNLGRYADVLTEYKTYTGAYVFHCHKLTHEDPGMMELMTVCDPAAEECDTLCAGGRCAWNACADGDTECQRQYFATRCVVTGDCGDAPAWCTDCSTSGSCPAGSYCSEQPTWDGVDRCVPGCEQDSDCAITEACAGNTCVAASCDSPCPPPTVCVHGACESPGGR